MIDHKIILYHFIIYNASNKTQLRKNVKRKSWGKKRKKIGELESLEKAKQNTSRAKEKLNKKLVSFRHHVLCHKSIHLCILLLESGNLSVGIGN